MPEVGSEREVGAGSKVRATAPWVRTRLRAAPGAAVALLLLALVSSFLAASFPRAVEAYEGSGLRQALRAAPADQNGLQVSDVLVQPFDPEDPAVQSRLGPKEMAERQRKILSALPQPLRVDRGQSSYGVFTSRPVDGSAPGLTRLDGGAPVFTLSAGAGVAEHSTVRSGRLPKAAVATPGSTAVEAVVTAATAKELNIAVGTVIRVPRGDLDPLAVTVTGVIDPLRPDQPYWSVRPLLRTPATLFTPGPPPEPYWHGALLLAPEAAPALLSVSPDVESYWRFALDPGGLRVTDLAALKAAVSTVESGPVLSELREAISPEVEADTEVDALLARYEELRSAVAPVVAVAAFGVGGVVGVVLLMAGGLAAARRHAELALVRSRGGSVPGMAGRLLAEVAVPVVPAAAAGCALAVLLVPEGRLVPAVVGAAVVTLVTCAALPLRAALVHRRPGSRGGRDDLVGARPSRRRTVAELTLLALTVAAVVALRRRGTDDGAAQGVDYLVSAAPLLLGAVAALLLVRLQPLPLRIAARPLARRRGAVGFLAMARAGRAPATSALPLVALLLALTTTAFGGSVLAGVDGARERAAVRSVGADARVEAATALPAGLADSVRKVPGVRGVVAVYRELDLDLGYAEGSSEAGAAGGVTLLAVDPDAYARLARSTGVGAFDAGALRAKGGEDAQDSADAAPLPAIVSPGVAERLGDDPVVVGPPSAPLQIAVASVRDETPALPLGDFVVVDAAGVPVAKQPTTLLVTGGSVAGDALRATVRAAGTDARVALRSEEYAAYADSPLQTGAERVYAVAAAAAAGYAVLALLLSLLRAAPERTALLARLRTMGLTRGQSRRLLVLESLPGTLLAGVGGVLVGWAVVLVLSPGIDLTRLAHASGEVLSTGIRVELAADPASLLLPGLGVVLVAAGVAAAQAWAVTRRTTTTELRVGDTR
ncbi:FtsX-like permease family protein [Streptomyces sp. NPDC020412]|uniref:FtsX-like permease family protein n=1 Tax=Streptomyces sp. NPDC020412 TaxID=3365073 RepID=UPI00379B4488